MASIGITIGIFGIGSDLLWSGRSTSFYSSFLDHNQLFWLDKIRKTPARLPFPLSELLRGNILTQRSLPISQKKVGRIGQLLSLRILLSPA
jgi:hypothetical protein